jgi:NADPH:quinone reductase-like Zn-dependent oxidoreductase
LAPISNPRRVRIRRPGGYDRLEIERDFHPGTPGPGEALIEVRAAGVNYADSTIRMGLYSSAKKYVGWPITPGFEFAGTVVDLGEEAPAANGQAGFRVGDEVFGVTRFGGWSSHLVVDRSLILPLPKELSLDEAAGFPTVFLTAYYPLFALTRLRPGETVLIHSAAGGVGGALIQLCRVAQCHTVGVVGSAHKCEVARALGADVVIDKSRGDLWREAERAAPGGFTMILDANGAATLRESYRHLRPGGRLVTYGFHSMFRRGADRPSKWKLALDWLRTPRFDPLRMVMENRSVLAFNLSYLFDERELFGDAMTNLLRWLEEGKVKPLPHQTFPVERVADAQRSIESGETTGKLILTF